MFNDFILLNENVKMCNIQNLSKFMSRDIQNSNDQIVQNLIIRSKFNHQ